MNKKGQFGLMIGILVSIVIIATIVAIVIIRSQPTTTIIINNTLEQNNTLETIKVANWNLQIFGVSKASKPELLQFYYDKLQSYDIIFVQEIRDASNTSFNQLCEKFPGYSCRISDRDGRTDSKEQVGIIYKSELGLITYYTQQDVNDVWERSPIISVFDNGIHIYNAHLKPDNVTNELHAFENIITYQGPVIILGDFNADCDYYNPSTDTAFDSWTWLINNDTTVSKNDCAYDRIIVNDYAKVLVKDYGIDSIGINTTYSDHYIVWSEIVWLK